MEGQAGPAEASRLLRLYLAAAAAVLLLLGCWSYRQAVGAPILRTAHYAPANWPAGAPPVRLLFLSDVHLGRPDMPPERFAPTVDRINALHPDCVLVGGDFVSEKPTGSGRMPIAEVVAAFARFRPRIATMLVRGNHDNWPAPGAVNAAAFRKAGLLLIPDQVARCGPLAIAGIDDMFEGYRDAVPTKIALRQAGGIPVLIAHSPDAFRDADGIGLTLTGHTHCGQIVLPIVGAPFAGTSSGLFYPCGASRRRGRNLIVSAGIGTSILPLRWNAPPDFWLITVGPRAAG